MSRFINFEVYMSIISLTLFKLFNKIATDDVTLDEYLSQLLEQAEDSAESYCNRKFLVSDYVEYYSGDNTNTLLLDNFPIQNVSKIERYDGENWTELVEGEDYTRLIIDKDKIILDGGIFEKGSYNYRVTYQAGYKEEEMPEDIKLGLLELSCIYFNESKVGDGNLLINSKDRNQMTESYDKNAEDKVLKYRFAKYRKWNVWKRVWRIC